MEFDKELFAAKLRGRIAELNLSRAEVSERSGVSEDTLNKYCNAKVAPGASNLVALALSLDSDPNTLLGWGVS